LSDPSEDFTEVTKLAEMIKYYSEPEQKDDNRYNCVLALALFKPRMKDLLSHDPRLYLSLKSSLIKLLIDELAVIRKKTCKIIYESTETLQNDNVSLVEAFRQIFSDLSDFSKTIKVEKQKQELATLIQFFLMDVSCDPTCEKYKYMAHYDSRIFNFDKPNKYKEEVKIIRAIVANLSLIPLREEMTPAPNEAYRVDKQVKRAENLEKEAQAAIDDPFKRSEFIFGQVVQGLFEKIVINKGGETDIEKKFLNYL